MFSAEPFQTAPLFYAVSESRIDWMRLCFMLFSVWFAIRVLLGNCIKTAGEFPENMSGIFQKSALTLGPLSRKIS